MAAEFADKTVVVTGAGSGIGRASAGLFARLGAKVHLADIDAEAAESAATEIGGGAVAHTVDCTDPDAVQGLAERVFEQDPPCGRAAQQRRDRARGRHRADHSG